MANNFQHGTSLLYTRIAQLFSAMLCYGYAPQLFLRSTMIPIPKGGKVCLQMLTYTEALLLAVF